MSLRIMRYPPRGLICVCIVRCVKLPRLSFIHFWNFIPSLRLGYANKFILQNSPTDALPQTPKIWVFNITYGICIWVTVWKFLSFPVKDERLQQPTTRRDEPANTAGDWIKPSSFLIRISRKVDVLGRINPTCALYKWLTVSGKEFNILHLISGLKLKLSPVKMLKSEPVNPSG